MKSTILVYTSRIQYNATRYVKERYAPFPINYPSRLPDLVRSLPQIRGYRRKETVTDHDVNLSKNTR